jgi:hypothetical protein
MVDIVSVSTSSHLANFMLEFTDENKTRDGSLLVSVLPNAGVISTVALACTSGIFSYSHQSHLFPQQGRPDVTL